LNEFSMRLRNQAMTRNLTREELYELVWSKPMTHVAKELGVSDVMVGKLCREKMVPKPPRGYWANLESENKVAFYVKPPLPDLFAQRTDFNQVMMNEYRVRDSLRTDRFDPENLQEPVPEPPKPFTESLQEFRVRIEGVFPKLPRLSDTQKVMHQYVQKVNEADLLIATRRKRERWAPDPKFQNEQGRQHLQLLDTFIRCFEFLGFDVTLRGRKNFVFSTHIFRFYKNFHVFVKKYEPSQFERKHLQASKKTTYCFAWSDDDIEVTKGKLYYEFDEITTDAVKTVVMDLVMREEESYRRQVIRGYASDVESRRDAIARYQKRLEVLVEMRKRAHEELILKRSSLLRKAVEDIAYADQIRELISIFQTKFLLSEEAIDDFNDWARWALAEASQIDPRRMNCSAINSWIQAFQVQRT